MSGFAAWARGPVGTMVAAGCLLVLAVILAYLAGRMVGERRAEEAAEREEAQARRTHPVYHQPPEHAFSAPGATVSRSQNTDTNPDPFAAIREAGRRAWAIQQERYADPGYMMGYRLSLNGQKVYDWQHDDPEPFSPEAAALVRDDLTDSAYTADMAARTDRFIEYVESLAWVPYSADELWSGQG